MTHGRGEGNHIGDSVDLALKLLKLDPGDLQQPGPRVHDWRFIMRNNRAHCKQNILCAPYIHLPIMVLLGRHRLAPALRRMYNEAGSRHA